MIWFYVITFLDKFLSAMLDTFRIPIITELPLGMDSAVSSGFGYFKEFMTLYPPIAIIFNAFIWYMGFKLVLLILRNIPVLKITTK